MPYKHLVVINRLLNRCIHWLNVKLLINLNSYSGFNFSSWSDKVPKNNFKSPSPMHWNSPIHQGLESFYLNSFMCIFNYTKYFPFTPSNFLGLMLHVVIKWCWTINLSVLSMHRDPFWIQEGSILEVSLRTDNICINDWLATDGYGDMQISSMSTDIDQVPLKTLLLQTALSV